MTWAYIYSNFVQNNEVDESMYDVYMEHELHGMHGKSELFVKINDQLLL